MKISALAINGLLVLEPALFQDQRGSFYESFNQQRFEDATGLKAHFVQDNNSQSARGVLRGLHYQIKQAQGKLVRVTEGCVFDVAVDLRRCSPTFGQQVAIELSAGNARQHWIPAGFAHGFLVLSESAQVQYKTTDYYAPEHERCLAWDDPALAIDWPLAQLGSCAIQISEKDRAGKPLAQADIFD